MIIILIGALNTLIEGIKEENDKVIGKYLSIKHCALTVAKLTPIPFVVIITQRWTDTRLNYIYLVDITLGDILDTQLVSIGQDTYLLYIKVNKDGNNSITLISPDITIDIIKVGSKYRFSKLEPYIIDF